ncbi:ImmA/IrrE family metallo-endopeptidase [Oceanobacillus profundus]|uniref:ImmA/IrrE family metallo-endopeptidase n=1 Tax=Oceanobacillus profundus TaxID=372463 RepID=UPI00203F010F|nr:ImmA/IrrE family metallo-endopeptidase [Oceanobacillus profundus]
MEQLIKKYGTNDPFELAKALYIEVVFEPLGDSFGYFSRFNRTTLIHINESLPYKKQITTCAHELGHVILHPDTNAAFLKSNTYYPTSKIEQEANDFMLELLFNREGEHSISIKEATEEYGAPKQLLYKNFYN